MLNEYIILSIPIGLSNCVLSPKQGLILEAGGNKIHSSLQQQEKYSNATIWAFIQLKREGYSCVVEGGKIYAG